MVFNGCVRRGRTWVGAIMLGAIVLSACGRSGYQYVESDDETVFAKIPDDWQLISEGIVDFALRPEDGSQLRLLPGDETLPWRAQFTADPAGQVRPDRVAGYVDVQPTDARIRETLTLEALLDYGPGGEALGDPIPVRLGDLEGYRVQFEVAGDDPLTNDRLVLTDDRRTVIYVIQVGCRKSCFDVEADEIDEIMTTFTVDI